MATFLQTLYDLPIAALIRESRFGFPWLESVHVLAIALVLGSIAVVDLRLLGLASTGRPVTALIRQLLPITWVAFIFAVATGGAMFVSNAVAYGHNLPLQLKLLLLVLAGINMLFFHCVTYRGVAVWNESRTPLAARCAGATSILLWIGIVAYGRWIGFTIMA